MNERLNILLGEFNPSDNYFHDDWGVNETLSRMQMYTDERLVSEFYLTKIESNLQYAVSTGYWTQEMSAATEVVFKFLGSKYTSRFAYLCQPKQVKDEVVTPDPLQFASLFIQACQPENLGMNVGMNFAYSYPDVIAHGLSPLNYYKEAKQAAYRKNRTFAGWFVRGLPDALNNGISLNEYEVALMNVYNEDRRNKHTKRELTKAFIFSFGDICNEHGSCQEFTRTIINLGRKYDKRQIGWITKTIALLELNSGVSDYGKDQFLADMEVLRKTRKYPETKRNLKRNDEYGPTSATLYARGLRELISNVYSRDFVLLEDYREGFGVLVANSNTTIQDLRYFNKLYPRDISFIERAKKIASFRSLVGGRIVNAFYWPMNNFDRSGYHANLFMDVVSEHFKQFGEEKTLADVKTTIRTIKILDKLHALGYFEMDRLITDGEMEGFIQKLKDLKTADEKKRFLYALDSLDIEL